MIKVLFAHADPKLTDLYQPRLASHFNVDSAQDGLTALRKFKLNRPGLVVTDYHLPLLSGIALLKFARSNNSAPIPFIFLTSALHTDHALGLGANDWLDLASATPDLLVERIYGQLKLHHYGL